MRGSTAGRAADSGPGFRAAACGWGSGRRLAVGVQGGGLRPSPPTTEQANDGPDPQSWSRIRARRWLFESSHASNSRGNRGHGPSTRVPWLVQSSQDSTRPASQWTRRTGPADGTPLDSGRVLVDHASRGYSAELLRINGLAATSGGRCSRHVCTGKLCGRDPWSRAGCGAGLPSRPLPNSPGMTIRQDPHSSAEIRAPQSKSSAHGQEPRSGSRTAASRPAAGDHTNPTPGRAGPRSRPSCPRRDMTRASCATEVTWSVAGHRGPVVARGPTRGRRRC